MFQLGYVNLPSAEIRGIESEFTFAVNDAWQIDATLGYNDAEVSEATDAHARGRRRQVYVRPVEKGARLPLTPDWSASLGIEWRSRGQLLNAQPFARADLAYVGESVDEPRGLRVGRRPGRRQRPRTPTKQAISASAWRASVGAASLFVDNIWDERAVTFRSNRWAVQRLSIIRPRTYGLQFRYDF